MIGYSGDEVIVENLGVINATVSGGNAGAIIGYNGTVRNCFVINCNVTAYSLRSENGVYAGAIAGGQEAILETSFAADSEIILGKRMNKISTLAPIGGKTLQKCYYVNVSAVNKTFRELAEEIFTLASERYENKIKEGQVL